jgi:HD-GYP domain-containing protein (c-di-GMP phosphodiesterase class II)
MPTEPSFLSAPLDAIPKNIDLPFPVYVTVAGKKTCLRNAGEKLTNDRLKTLEKKIDTVFIPSESWNLFLDYLEKNGESETNNPTQTAKSLHALLFAYTKHMERMREVQRNNVTRLRTLAYDLVNVTFENPQITAELLKRYKDHSVYFANHSVNMALYAIALGKKLKFTNSELKSLAFACLVANIGNALLPEELLYRNGKLTESEWKLIRGHSHQGAELLEYLDAPEEVITVARQHHERMDGQGYPFGLKGKDIHPFAKICAIADVYDALISQKPYGEPPLTPEQAILTMQGMHGKFDPDILTMIGTA